METYLEGLLADLRASHGNFPPRVNMRAFAPRLDYPESRESLMAFLYGPRYSLPDLFGLEAEVFPPADQLSEEQVVRLTQAILDAWASLNIEVTLPKNLPLPLVYPMLVHCWKEEKFPIVHDAKAPIELCPGHPSKCPWPLRYCMCKD